MEREVKTLATVSVSDEATPEEKAALEKLLADAGLLVATHGNQILVQTVS